MIASSAAGASAACLSLPVYDKEPQLVIRREIFEKCAFERLPLLQRLHSGPDAAAAVLAWSAQCGLNSLPPESPSLQHQFPLPACQLFQCMF